MEPEPFLINGEWRRAATSNPVVNPYDGRIVAQVSQAGPGDIDEAIGASVRAFGVTRGLQAYERATILTAIAEGIRERKEELARLITSDTGKPISLSRAEIERSIFTFQAASEEAKRVSGEVLPLDLAPHSRDRFAITRRFPLGPIAAITPFNFPLNLVAHKIAPALAAGNAVVLKPASTAARVALMLGQIITGSGAPPGSVNIVTCSGGNAGQLISDERLKAVTFTGSPDVGWRVKSSAGKKKVVLELGGNAGVIIDEGTDLESVIHKIADAAFGNAGQSCISVQRIFVHRSFMESFCRLLVLTAETINVGDPESEATRVGPMISEEAAVRVEGWLRQAARDGATILCGGEREGAVMRPAVVTNVRPGMDICAQEVFAPVVTVEPFDSLEDAVRMVNDSRYGLQAGIFSNNLKGVLDAYRILDVGGVIVNDVPTYRIDHMPYGGIKDSGFGREGIRYAMEEMSELKLLVFSPGVS